MTTVTTAADKKAADKRAARGTKRTCQNSECESRFYDLHQDPIHCPICNATYVIEVVPPPAPKRVPAPVVAKPAPAAETKEVDEDAEDVADIETDDKAVDDDSFLASEDDEEGPAVAGIVGTAGKEGTEET